MANRIYQVTANDGALIGLVRASTKVGALRHIAEQHFTVDVAGQEQLVWAISNGMSIADAGAEEPKAAEPAEA